MSTASRTLSTAEQRRDELVEAAVRVFAELGYAAPTTAIAKAAGISQAYLFRLFPTKDELFVAAVAETNARMLRVFEAAAAEARQTGEPPLQAMGRAYGELLELDRDLLLVQINAQMAASQSEAVRYVLHEGFAAYYALGQRESGASAEELRGWFAMGMLCNVMAAIDADRVDAPWAKVLAGHPECD